MNTPPIRWGIEHEQTALKAFYAENVTKHLEFKTEKSGLFILAEKPYIAGSPDGFMMCKCHGKLPLEIKCPYKIRDKTIMEGVNDCDFLLKTSSGNITINNAHKYFTQVNSQMAVTNTSQAMFIVWTTKDIFYEILSFDKEHWGKVKTNLDIFFEHIYVLQCCK